MDWIHLAPRNVNVIKPSSCTKFRVFLHLLRGCLLLEVLINTSVFYFINGVLVYRRFSIYTYTRLNISKDIYYVTLFNIKQIYTFLGP
jgi:hypothetical protein